MHAKYWSWIHIYIKCILYKRSVFFYNDIYTVGPLVGFEMRIKKKNSPFQEGVKKAGLHKLMEGRGVSPFFYFSFYLYPSLTMHF